MWTEQEIKNIKRQMNHIETLLELLILNHPRDAQEDYNPELERYQVSIAKDWAARDL